MTAPSAPGVLKACPFCGGVPERIMAGSINQFIRCASCKCSTDDTGESSDAAWNTRASAEVTEDVVERVARAICCPDGGCYMARRNEMADIAANYDAPFPCLWRQNERRARAALAAIPEGGKK